MENKLTVNQPKPQKPREYETYSHIPKNQKMLNINQEFLQNKIKMIPHVKLKESKFGNIFIPVLPSSLTDAGNF
jgi:hypothetical protein